MAGPDSLPPRVEFGPGLSLHQAYSDHHEAGPVRRRRAALQGLRESGSEQCRPHDALVAISVLIVSLLPPTHRRSSMTTASRSLACMATCQEGREGHALR